MEIGIIISKIIIATRSGIFIQFFIRFDPIKET